MANTSGYCHNQAFAPGYTSLTSAWFTPQEIYSQSTRMKYPVFFSILLLSSIDITTVLAQSAGQSVTVVKGVVSKTENASLETTDNAAGGAVVGGAIGYNAGSGRSSTQKRRQAILGAGIGSTAASSGTTSGMRYSVELADGSTVVVVSDVLTINVDDCVSVEQSADRASIRKVDQAVCDLEAQSSVSKPAKETTGQSNECEDAKQLVLTAKTPDEVEVAKSKVEILCN